MFVIAQATVHMKRLLSIAIIAFISIGLLEIGTRLIYLALFDANYDHNHQKVSDHFDLKCSVWPPALWYAVVRLRFGFHGTARKAGAQSSWGDGGSRRKDGEDPPREDGVGGTDEAAEASIEAVSVAASSTARRSETRRALQQTHE